MRWEKALSKKRSRGMGPYVGRGETGAINGRGGLGRGKSSQLFQV